ncbi:stage V sporulation protein AD [Vallitalea sp.]|jgi:stage V sporulation protein AD|uniref:stage V sporulation protein AD n=1 Tax=Vallitalea sp. TaxID=1882829 RepID=UPI0025D12E1F|nr:stage V sporulation protein AD [Vallitalea sp.]MCT4686513.1 stage V sporulation protein AD [Vallitalea sp.]
MGSQVGEQTIAFDNPPTIIGQGNIVGPKEGNGLLKEYFDKILEDTMWGEESWEKAESKILNTAINLAIDNANIAKNDIRYIFAGDLLNQLTASTFAIRDFKKAFFGLYGACSTMGESLILASMAVEGGFANYCVAATSSHFCGAEKQFRYPLEFGNQRPLTATYTVTGSGAVVVGNTGNGPKITHVTPGKIIDLGVKDTMNMGAAMAPAAADTIITHFKDTGRCAADYDLIATGDLGMVGKKLTIELVGKAGYDLSNNYTDCGIEIFDNEKQDTQSGGSGCGCSAVTLTGYILKEMAKGTFNRILFIPTGALLSPSSSFQGESIPGIAHAVVIQNSQE